MALRQNMNFLKRNSDGDDLRRYLLGSLAEKLRKPLEQRVLTDSRFYEELLATEDDLVDEYLAGQLNEQERLQFESHFSILEERQRKVRFGRTLRDYLDSFPVADPQEEHQGGKARLFSRAPIFAGFLDRKST